MDSKHAQQLAQHSRIENIAKMAVRYSAMSRVFEKGSKAKIVNRVLIAYKALEQVKSKPDYDDLHRGFCDWFTSEIRTASRKLKNGRFKASGKASFGQAAKTLDVAMKVYVHYCRMPDSHANRIVDWLNCAIDTKILRQLRRKYPNLEDIKAITVEGIEDPPTYRRLQDAVRRDIKDKYSRRLHPVEYDDLEYGQL